MSCFPHEEAYVFRFLAVPDAYFPRGTQSRARSGGRGNSRGGRKTAGPVTSAVAAKRAPEPKLDSLSDRAGFLSAFEYYRKANAPRKMLQARKGRRHYSYQEVLFG